MLPGVQLETFKHTDRGGLRLNGAKPKELLVSVVCVTLNAAKTLSALITSIRHNKTDAVEFVIIDGRSSDGTVDILKENEDVIDFWLSKPDNGIYDAMNRAINYVKGKWLIFLGADDLLLDGFKNMMPLLNDLHTIYYGNVIFHGKAFNKEYDDYYLTKLNICHQAIFYPRALFSKYNYEQRYRVYADYHLNLRCWGDPAFKFVYAGYTVAYYQEGGYSSYTKDIIFEREKDALFKKHLKITSYYRYLNRTVGFFGMLRRLLQNN